MKLLLNLSRYYRTEGYIKLTVGPDKVSWVLNKELVCDRIPVLKRHIDASSSTPDCQIIHLKHDPVVFAFMIDVSIPVLCLHSSRFLDFAAIYFPNCISSSSVLGLRKKTHTDPL
jgi:hypothetical protein